MYKNTKPLPDSFKIKVNPEQSRVLQEYLFSNGKYWMSGDKNVKGTENKYLYFTEGIGITILSKDMDFKNKTRLYFRSHKNQRIRFKDYFAKEIFMLPEKWCIEVTQDNYKELNVYLHRNWKKYDGYKDNWETNIDCRYFYSKSVQKGFHSDYNLFQGYQLITTEQFRKQFGTITETKLQGTKAGNKEFKAEHEGILKNPKTNESKLDTEIRTLIMKIQQSMSGILPLEIERLKNENKSLKTTIEAIKEIIQDNPIIKK